jgi:hypothetical protein
VSSFLSHKAFRRNPRAKNAIAVKRSAIVADVSLKTKDRMMGRMIKIPAIWSTKPIFASSAFKLI